MSRANCRDQVCCEGIPDLRLAKSRQSTMASHKGGNRRALWIRGVLLSLSPLSLSSRSSLGPATRIPKGRAPRGGANAPAPLRRAWGRVPRLPAVRRDRIPNATPIIPTVVSISSRPAFPSAIQLFRSLSAPPVYSVRIFNWLCFR